MLVARGCGFAFSLQAPEGKATVAGDKITVEGTYTFAGDDGELRGLAGGGTFKTVLKSESEIECAWTGEYKLAEAQAK